MFQPLTKSPEILQASGIACYGLPHAEDNGQNKSFFLLSILRLTLLQLQTRCLGQATQAARLCRLFRVGPSKVCAVFSHPF